MEVGTIITFSTLYDGEVTAIIAEGGVAFDRYGWGWEYAKYGYSIVQPEQCQFKRGYQSGGSSTYDCLKTWAYFKHTACNNWTEFKSELDRGGYDKALYKKMRKPYGRNKKNAICYECNKAAELLLESLITPKEYIDELIVKVSTNLVVQQSLVESLKWIRERL